MSQRVRTKTRTETDPPAFNLRRLRAALDIRGGSVEAIARDAKLSSRHVWFCLNHQRRATDRLLGVIRAALLSEVKLGDLDALLDQLSPSLPVDLAGHSMGGNIVMNYAGVRTQRVRRLVNLEGFSLPQTRAEQTPKRLRQWLDELKQPQALRDYASVDEVAARLIKTNPRLAADKAAWLAAQWSRRGSDGRWHVLGDAAHKRVNPVLTRAEDIIAMWSRIRAPLLWVEGDAREFERAYGERYTREQFEQRLAAVPSVQRLRLPAAGHMLHHDQPEALAQALERFLDSG